MSEVTATPIPGTVIHGTLRPEDLVDAFSRELRLHDEDRAKQLEHDYADVYRILDSTSEELIDHPEVDEELFWLMDDLLDALNEIAPRGWYFGSLEGDASDFGWWLTDETAERLENAQELRDQLYLIDPEGVEAIEDEPEVDVLIGRRFHGEFFEVEFIEEFEQLLHALAQKHGKETP